MLTSSPLFDKDHPSPLIALKITKVCFRNLRLLKFSKSSKNIFRFLNSYIKFIFVYSVYFKYCWGPYSLTSYHTCVSYWCRRSATGSKMVGPSPPPGSLRPHHAKPCITSVPQLSEAQLLTWIVAHLPFGRMYYMDSHRSPSIWAVLYKVQNIQNIQTFQNIQKCPKVNHCF